MTSLQALHDTFAAFGNVLSCKVATDEHGRSRGFGYVHYETAEAAETAIKAVNGMLLNDKKVYVGYHISRKASIRMNVIVGSAHLATGASVEDGGDEGPVHEHLRQELGPRGHPG